MTSCIPQLWFSFYRHRSIRADFSGGQITSDAGLLPLRAFDQRHGLTRGLAACVGDDRDDSRVSHPGAGSGSTRELSCKDAEPSEAERSLPVRDGTMDQQRLGGAIPRAFSATQTAEPALRADQSQGLDL
jgi:Transposase DDE domain group 1